MAVLIPKQTLKARFTAKPLKLWVMNGAEDTARFNKRGDLVELFRKRSTSGSFSGPGNLNIVKEAFIKSYGTDVKICLAGS